MTDEFTSPVRGSTWRSKRNGREVVVNDFMILGVAMDVQVSYERDGKGWLKWLSLRGFLRDYEQINTSINSFQKEDD